MKNKDIKKVVFYSTRKISPYFSDKEHLDKCDSMISYFSLLKQIDKKTQKEMKDKLSEWLSDQALLSEYLQKITEIGSKNGYKDEVQEIIEEVSTIVKRAEKEAPSDLLDELTTRLNKQKVSCEDPKRKSFWEEVFNAFINLNNKYLKDENKFLPEHFEMHKDYVLSGEVTHLNLRLEDITESNNEKSSPEKNKSKEKKPEALLKHRLGIYHKEENEYAVAAIWPWAGETEPNHDVNWRETILNAIREFYPQCDEIILAIHGEDFPGLIDSEKDRILFVGRKLTQMNNPDAPSDSKPNAADPRVSLITFHHTNKNVLNPIQKKNNKGCMFSPKQVWELINGYLKRDSLRVADNNNSVAEMHNSTDNV